MGAFGRHIIAVATMYGDYGRGGSYVPKPKKESTQLEKDFEEVKEYHLKNFYKTNQRFSKEDFEGDLKLYRMYNSWLKEIAKNLMESIKYELRPLFSQLNYCDWSQICRIKSSNFKTEEHWKCFKKWKREHKKYFNLTK